MSGILQTPLGAFLFLFAVPVASFALGAFTAYERWLEERTPDDPTHFDHR